MKAHYIRVYRISGSADRWVIRYGIWGYIHIVVADIRNRTGSGLGICSFGRSRDNCGIRHFSFEIRKCGPPSPFKLIIPGSVGAFAGACF